LQRKPWVPGYIRGLGIDGYYHKDPVYHRTEGLKPEGLKS